MTSLALPSPKCTQKHMYNVSNFAGAVATKV